MFVLLVSFRKEGEIMNKRDKSAVMNMLNCIINEDAYNKSYTEPKDKVEFLLRMFNEEYNHSYNKNEFRNLLIELNHIIVVYLQFSTLNSVIITLSRLANNGGTVRQRVNRNSNQWWHRIANITLQLADKLEIDYEQNYQLV